MKRLIFLIAPAGLALLLGLPVGARPSITGVCPDGSMFIVTRAADIPCPNAKEVDPHDLPPIRPSYLPRPYGWEVFQNKQDPNNPYNLVGRAGAIREGGQPTEPAGEAPRAEPAPQQRAALAPVDPLPTAPGPLSLSATERRDLASIVELTQRRAPARIASEGMPLVIELAYSAAFETRLRKHYRGDPLGPAVLFRAIARDATAFHPNFTFVQGRGAHHPVRHDPKQLGALSGAFGELDSGDAVLGYAVLPEGTDLGRPLDVYWNDRRISVVLSP